MSRSFKLVGRYTERCRFNRGKVGTQAKKRVYTSLEDFNRYAPDTLKRWKKFCGFRVEAYERKGNKWVTCPLPRPKIDPDCDRCPAVNKDGCRICFGDNEKGEKQ